MAFIDSLQRLGKEHSLACALSTDERMAYEQLKASGRDDLVLLQGDELTAAEGPGLGLR